MNDGPWKLHKGYLVEGLELFIRKVAYTKYDAIVLVRWSKYSNYGPIANISPFSEVFKFVIPEHIFLYLKTELSLSHHGFTKNK
jgi:hypothetical protein